MFRKTFYKFLELIFEVLDQNISRNNLNFGVPSRSVSPTLEGFSSRSVHISGCLHMIQAYKYPRKRVPKI